MNLRTLLAASATLTISRALSLLLSLLLIGIVSSFTAQAQTFSLEFGECITNGIGGSYSRSLVFTMPIVDRFSGYVGYMNWLGRNTREETYLNPSSNIVIDNTTGPIFWGNHAFTLQILYAFIIRESFKLHIGGGAFIHEKIALDNINAGTSFRQELRERSVFEPTFTASLIGEYQYTEAVSFMLRFYYAGPGFVTEARHFGSTLGVGLRLW